MGEGDYRDIAHPLPQKHETESKMQSLQRMKKSDIPEAVSTIAEEVISRKLHSSNYYEM